MEQYKMIATNPLDIENCEQWDESQTLSFVRDRLNKMRAKRAPFDWDNQTNPFLPSVWWTQYEEQINATTVTDEYWQLIPIIPVEKELIEIYEWRSAGNIVYDIIPDEQTDIDELQPSKFTMKHYLDWDWKENFWVENKKMRRWCATYGSSIAYTWIRKYVDYVPKPKEESDLWDDLHYWMKEEMDFIENVEWFFHPQAIHPRDFYIDDSATGQRDVQYAEDCIMKEKMTVTKFNSIFWNEKYKNQDKLTYWWDIQPKNKNDTPIATREVVVYYYFHRIKKKFIIFVNETVVIYDWYYEYNDGKLPFENMQFFTREDRFYGEGIPERIGYVKAMKTKMWTHILTASSMSSSVNLLVWWDDQIGQDWTIWGNQMNLWRTTWWADKVQRIDTSMNLSTFQTIMQMLDQEEIKSSWINVLAQIESQAPTLWQERLLEENRAVRNASIEENYNLALDWMLTMMFSRIKQFAPYLESEKIKDENWKVIKVIFPKIRIEWYEVKEKKWQFKVVENYGKYWYFELKPELIRWLWVKVQTRSTKLMQPELEKNKIDDYVKTRMQIWQIAQLDPTGQALQKLLSETDFKQLIEWVNDWYGIDNNSLKSKTKKDEIKEENQKKLEEFKNILQAWLGTNPQDLQTNPNPNVAQNQTEAPMTPPAPSM